jgi:TrmH family RNA methyltransferase
MGAIFAVPVVHARPDDQLPGRHRSRSTPGAERTLATWQPSPIAPYPSPAERHLLVGAEREGLPDELWPGRHVARIPIATDSLNAAMAATVALYELTRRMAPA